MSQLIFARNRVKTCLLQNYFAQNSFRSFRTSPMKFSKENVNKGKLNEFSRLLGMAKPDKKKIAVAVGLLCISSGVTMAVPFAMGKIIDIIYSMDQLKNDKSKENNHKEDIQKGLNKVCLVLVGVFALGGLANFGRVYLMRIAAQNITARLRTSVFGSIVKQEAGYFDKTKTGELVNRLSADSQLVSQAVTQQISDGLRSTMMTTAGIGMMFFMSPQLAFVSLSVVPPVALWAVWMGKRVKSTSKSVQDALAQSTSVAEEKISNIRTVRAFAKENLELQRYALEMSNVLKMSQKEALVNAKFYGMTGISGNMIILTVLYYGGSLVTTDVISVGNLTSFILYAAYVGIGFNGVSTFYAEIMKALGASSRLWQIIDKNPSIPFDQGLIPKTGNLTGNISFDNIDFSYPSRPDISVLKNLSLHVPSDHVMAVVGGSGSGKSTLASLLLRLYDPDKGQITIDGYNIKDLNPIWLRNHIGTVTQEPILFSSTIRDNIAYGAEDPDSVTDQEIEQAAKEANAHDFVMGFPEKYETLVGERGVMLSGGQKQRVAIARAILKNPQILLLDEATSALDTASEHQVKEALDRVMKGRSVITIAHRLSTIKNADTISVLKDGKVVEQGTYQNLLSIESGHFKSLVRK